MNEEEEEQYAVDRERESAYLKDYSYVNRAYGLQLRKGQRFKYHGLSVTKRNAAPQYGTVVGACGAHFWGKIDGYRYWDKFHPTWAIEYLPVFVTQIKEKST